VDPQPKPSVLHDFFVLYSIFVATGAISIALVCSWGAMAQQLRNRHSRGEHMRMALEFRRQNGQPVMADGFTGDMAIIDRRQLSYHEEEFSEFFDAILNGEPDSQRLKELADDVFTAYQFAAWRGWDLDEALRRVGTSNLSKRNADGSPLLKGPDGKVPKGDCYKPPYLDDLV
jgi:hypothetical protein